MTLNQVLPIALTVIGFSVASTLAVIAVAKTRRGRGSVRSRSLLAPYRNALIAMASGEDEDGQAKDTLYAVPAPTWVRLRPNVLAFLPKVRGTSADDLRELMRFHGEIDRAKRMLTSRSAVRRAHAAYLLGLARDRFSSPLLLPLLNDPDADVRLVAARALGVIGEPLAASGILGALDGPDPDRRVPPGLPARALGVVPVRCADPDQRRRGGEVHLDDASVDDLAPVAGADDPAGRDDAGARWRDLGAILLASVLENLGYRQATAWWRLEGWAASLVGRKQVWGTMTRQGFGDESPAVAALSGDVPGVALSGDVRVPALRRHA